MSLLVKATVCSGLLLAAGLQPVLAQTPAPTTPPAPRPAAVDVQVDPAAPTPQPNAAAQPSVAVQAGTAQPGVTGQASGAQPQAQQHQGQLFRAKQILGSKVQLSGNVSAGTVEDFVVAEDGYVEYVIVSNNGQMVTVPWDAAQFNYEKQTAVINIEQEQFKKIPTYTAEKYPVFTEPQYRTTIYRSYGLTPRERPALLPRNRRP